MPSPQYCPECNKSIGPACDWCGHAGDAKGGQAFCAIKRKWVDLDDGCCRFRCWQLPRLKQLRHLRRKGHRVDDGVLKRVGRSGVGKGTVVLQAGR